MTEDEETEKVNRKLKGKSFIERFTILAELHDKLHHKCEQHRKNSIKMRQKRRDD